MTVAYDPERAAEILVDASAMGDRSTARKWDISTRTIERYRVRIKTDEVLSGLVAERRKAVEHELSVMRVAYMRRALRSMTKKLPKATLLDVAESMKIVGDLHHVGIAVEDEQPDSEDSTAAEAEGSRGGAPVGPH